MAAAIIAALATSSLVHASPVTIETGTSYDGFTLTGGSGTLSFSSSLITALNVGKITLTQDAPATVNETYVTTPPFGTTRTGASANAPITSVTLESSSNEVLSVATAGGATMTASPLAGVSLGGTLSVTNITVDLSNKRIYASITGNFTGVANNTYAAYDNTDITTKNNFYLWNFANITGPTTLTAYGASNQITGLTITTDGYKHLVSALRLYELGATTLQSVTDYGSIASVIPSSVLDDGPATNLPEPSTYAMSALGLAMIAAARRFNRKV
ncbi:MAG TPA: hypothetical protein H9903_04665 [Candidatus Aquabacterium excrementipullorum]|nr:hypothetical protein [Candidatus Aquabacterium excrementipullorum]